MHQTFFYSYGVSYTDEDIFDPATRAQLYGHAIHLTQDVITIEDDNVNIKRQTKKKKVRKVETDELEEGTFFVKVAFVIGQIGEWNEREDCVVVNLSLAHRVEYRIDVKYSNALTFKHVLGTLDVSNRAGRVDR